MEDFITIEKLDLAHEQAQEKTSAIHADFKPMKDAYDAKLQEVQNEFNVILQKYYDGVCVDANGDPVRFGDIINNGNLRYKVVARGMQFFMGTMFYNPRVSCLRIWKTGLSAPSSRPKDLFPKELCQFTIEPKQQP